MEYGKSTGVLLNEGNSPTGLGGNTARFESAMKGGAYGYGFDGKSVAPGIADFERMNTSTVTGGKRKNKNKNRTNKNKNRRNKSRKNRTNKNRKN